MSLSSRIKRPGREDGISPPFSAEIKKDWSYTFNPLDVFMKCIGTNIFPKISTGNFRGVYSSEAEN
jgi:hypothetical protein